MAIIAPSAAWEPRHDTLTELASYLRNALNPRDPVAQKEATLVIAPVTHQERLS